MKKWKISIKKAILIAFCAVILIVGGFMYKKLSELTNQLTYLQDSTSVILSDMGNLQSNIEKTLQEEASAIEDYSITVVGYDFANKTYKVDVSVVPKEYTDKTQISIYFGTTECPLKRGEYAFTSNMELPLDKNFDGNITFLISNGRKKTTEVLNDYEGLYLNLDKVLTANLEKEPTYRSGELRLDSVCNVELAGNHLFDFESLNLVMMLDDKLVAEEDLLAQMSGLDGSEGGSGAGTVDSTESTDSDSAATGTTSGISGSVSCELAYKVPEADTEDSESEADIPEKQHLRILVRAKTIDGYWFEYTMFEGDYLTLDKRLDKESFKKNTKNAAYDRNGNELDLDVNEIQEDE